MSRKTLSNYFKLKKTADQYRVLSLNLMSCYDDITYIKYLLKVPHYPLR